MTMLDKAREAGRKTYYDLADSDGLHSNEGWDEVVRAVLRAIREPNEAMLNVTKHDEYDWAGRNFTAMIDVILTEKP